MPIRTTLSRLGGATLLLLLAAQTSFAQRIDADTISWHSTSTEHTKRPYITLGGVAGGIVGGGAGLFGGMLAGVVVAHAGTCNGTDCSLGASLVGAVVGEAIGVAVGAHLGSGRRGHLAQAVMASVGITAVGALALSHPSRAAPAIAISVPLLQFASVLALER